MVISWGPLWVKYDYFLFQEKSLSCIVSLKRGSTTYSSWPQNVATGALIWPLVFVFSRSTMLLSASRRGARKVVNQVHDLSKPGPGF